MFLPRILSHVEAAGDILFRVDFNSLDTWEPFSFTKVNRQSAYRIVEIEGKTALEAQSDSSASAIISKERYNVSEYPTLRWRWRVENTYGKSSGGAIEMDDYPIRIYILFKFNPKKASFGERLSYGVARTLSGGRYPPHSSICFVWSNGPFSGGEIYDSPYTSKARIIPLRSPADGLSEWHDEEVNVLDYYRRAFGAEPPTVARIAVMNDSDDTKEKSRSYLDFIEISK